MITWQIIGENMDLRQINLRDPSTVLKLTNYQKAQNDLEWVLIERYMNVFIERFQYRNLPEEIPQDIPERWLFWWRCTTAFDMGTGYAVLPPIMTGDINLYWRPTKWAVAGGNGFYRELNEGNSVLNWNDKAKTCPIYQIFPTIRRMADLIFTADTNLNAQKNPFIFAGEKDQMLTAANTYEQVTGNKTVLFMSKKHAAQLTETNVFNTEVEYKGLEFYRMLQIYENQILTYFGINNVNVEKRERLVTDEAEANTQLTQLNLDNAKQQREEDWNKFNKMFGTNVDVILNDCVTFKSPADELIQTDRNFTSDANGDVTGGNK